jgi:hypothetical protein
MTWLLLSAIALAFAVRFARRRRRIFTVAPSESISTLHLEMSRKHTTKTRAALDAATAALR